MNAKLITIGITCYNAQDTIARAIESALAQDWESKEIIVVDDCSSDSSRDIVRSFPQVRLIEHSVNKGPGGARQTLVQNARGEFLAFFDDDDESFPNRLRIQYERIATFEKEYPGALCACYASGERLYANGYILPIRAPGTGGAAPHGPDMAGRILFFKDLDPAWSMGATPSCALMARVSTFQSVGGFDPDFRRIEDLDFAVRLALSNGYFIGTKEPLFRQHATTGADKAPEKNLEAEQRLARKYRAYLEGEKAWFHALHWPELRYFHFQRNYLQFARVLTMLLIDAPLRTLRHLCATGPKRLAHEKKMEQ